MHAPYCWKVRTWGMTRLIALGWLLIGLLGCQDEPQIRHYTAPRVSPGENRTQGQEQMLLGAMTWVNGVGWFFRTVGPRHQLAPQREAFHSFLRSLELTEEQARWQLPQDWHAEARTVPTRYATLRLGKDANAPELVVVRFPPGQGGDVAGNINRWRELVGLPKVSAEEAEKLVSRLKTPQHEFLVVELTGPGKPR
ncbi:MAG: hypothetical protein NZM42_13695 [Gemmatales bacterium]|nr:hypothetical protein [Gemmatales bacterium]MDW8222564.1 hypothetical protein [Gemmatales bacterium]